MKIGILNEILSDISTKLSLDATINANPTKNEKILVKWDVVRNTTLSLFLSLSDTCFVDRVEVLLGDKTNLKSVTLKDNKTTLYTYSAETGKIITEKSIMLEAGISTNELTISFESDFSDVEILSVVLYGATFDQKDIFPTPDSVSFGGDFVSPECFDTFFTDSDISKNAGEILCEKYNEITGVNLVYSNNAKIQFITDKTIKAEGFSLEITKDKAIIKSGDIRGFVMGAETFIKLCEKDKVHISSIIDSPAFSFRGVHLYLPSERQMPFAKRLIKYLISPMGYNKVIIEVAGGMKFDSHPEINDAVIHANKMNDEGKWPEFPHSGVSERGCTNKEAVKDFISYIRHFGIDVIPEIQSLGHVQFMTLAHPDIAEIEDKSDDLNIDTRDEDARPEAFYKHCYCPSNPKSYEILFDLIDEIVDVFKPTEYVHMGHDEVYEIGVCPVCKGKDPAVLYYEDIMKIRSHLMKKGLKMIIWSDMIQPSSPYLTRPALDMIPKDIFLLDFIWYFHLEKDIEDPLLERGFNVGIGNLYSSHYPRYEKRIRKDGMIGGQISAWVATNEESLQKEGKFYDFIMTSEMLWSKDYKKVYTLCYDKMIKDMLAYIRQNLKDIKYPSLMDNALVETIINNDITFPPLKKHTQITDINIDGEYKSLIFNHTELNKLTRLPWQNHDITGKYILTYDDLSIEEIPITNGGIIGHYKRRQNEPLLHPLYRHTGYISTYYVDSEEFKTKTGDNVCIYKYEHILPKDKKLKKVALVQSEDFDTDIFLLKLEGVKYNEFNQG